MTLLVAVVRIVPTTSPSTSGTGVFVGSGIGVFVGSGVGVFVGSGTGVFVGSGVAVGRGVFVGFGRGVLVGSRRGVRVGFGRGVLVGPGLVVAVALGRAACTAGRLVAVGRGRCAWGRLVAVAFAVTAGACTTAVGRTGGAVGGMGSVVGVGTRATVIALGVAVAESPSPASRAGDTKKARAPRARAPMTSTASIAARPKLGRQCRRVSGAPVAAGGFG